MKKLVLLIVFIISISCDFQKKKTQEVQPFSELKNDFINSIWEMSPFYASVMGLDKYDTIVTINSLENLERIDAITDSLLAVVQNYPDDNLNQLEKIDLWIMKDFNKMIQWYNKDYKHYEWDPSMQNLGMNIGTIMNRNKDSLELKLNKVSALLKNTASFYSHAYNRIKVPSKKHLELSIQQNTGTRNYLKYIAKMIEQSKLDSWQRKQLHDRITVSDSLIGNYIDNLEGLIEKGKFRGTRIGKENFNTKFKFEINSSFSADEIYKIALSEKEKTHLEMIELSEQLWSKYLKNSPQPEDKLTMVKMVINQIAENNLVDQTAFFDTINEQVEELTQFVNKKNLVNQDPSKPLKVRETPEYMRGIAGASISPPGPYDKEGTTFYNVTPLDGYSEKEAKSYLKEYNKYILKILNVHEAIPGHYTQFIHANKSKSLIKSIFFNGAMVEGWACYTELMMLEEGLDDTLEMWLMYKKWYLRIVSNAILDYSYHALEMNEEEAMQFIINETFQEQTAANEKWNRVTLSSVQLSSYFTGFQQIYSLREKMKTKKGKNFDLKEFHEEFLSYGNSPVKYIRSFMLEKVEKELKKN